MTADELLSALSWRYATKVFDPARKIPADTWAAVERSLVATPSSFGLQPWRFLVVADPALRERLVPASWNQRQVADASHLVVFCACSRITEADVQKLIDATSAARGIPAAALDGYKQLMINDVVRGPRSKVAAEWSARQCYIALGQLMTACAVLGLDACPMEGFDPAQYDRILGLEGTSWRAVVACPVGYRAADDKYAQLAKVRYPAEDVIIRR